MILDMMFRSFVGMMHGRNCDNDVGHKSKRTSEFQEWKNLAIGMI